MGIARAARLFGGRARSAKAWPQRQALGGGLALAVVAGVLTAAPALAAVAPDPPTNISAVAGDTTATVSWTPPASDGGSPIVSYLISAQPGTERTDVQAPATSGVINGLTNGLAYTFTVRATNAAGFTSVASVKSNQVVPGGGPAATVPGAPTNVLAVAGDQGATVSWEPPADDGSSPITEYRVNVKPGDFFQTVAAPETSVFFGGLVNGVEYTFTVRASNDVGNGAYSLPSNPVVPGGGAGATIPDPPTEVTATAGDSRAIVSWTPPANDGGAPIQEYRVNVKPGTDYRIVPAPATSVDFAPLANGTAVTFTVKAINRVGQSLPSTASNTVTPTAGQAQEPVSSRYAATPPRRILDTRKGTGAPLAKVSAGQAVTVALPGLPADVTAVTLNITVTNATSTSYLAAYPAGTTRPNPYSNINVKVGQTVANLAVVRVGAGGKVSIYNSAGTVDIIADLIGHYSPTATSGHSATTPVRVLDTRYGVGAARAKVGAGKAVTITLPGLPTNATAATLNITATNASTSTYLAAYPAGTTRPNPFSNVNLRSGQTVANLVITSVSADAKVTIFNYAGTVDIIADVIGYFSPGSAASHTAPTPKRVLDTRVGVGAPKAQLGPGQTLTLTIPGLPSTATSVTLNLTAIHASTSTYLAAYAAGATRPNPYSNVNVKPGQIVANLAVSQVGTGGKVRIFNYAGSVHVIADLVGYYAP